MMVCMLGICLMLNSCYHRHNSHQQHAAMLEYSDRQLDSISFSTTHHYTNKYNFMVFKDSIHLMRQQPEELVSGLSVDSFSVKKEPASGCDRYPYGATRQHRLCMGSACH